MAQHCVQQRLISFALACGACLAPATSRADQRAATASAANLSEAPAAAWLERHREQPAALRQFVQRLPKGSDLHTHLSGAVYAERYLQWAMADGYCVDAATIQLVAPQDCGKTTSSFPAAELFQRRPIYQALIDRWSLRNLPFAGRSGHDQFFQAFAGFERISAAPNRKGDMVADVANRAASQVVHYLELLITTQGGEVKKLAESVEWSGNWAAMRRQLLQAGLTTLVSQGSRELAQIEAQKARSLGCASTAPQAGCQVTIRYQQQTNRTRSAPEVFTQLLYAFELASADRRVVGVNLVAPEDDPVALRDYPLQMAMIAFLRPLYPHVKVSLHAGELTLGLVPPEHLRSHIRQAVQVARAERIGHGVAIAYEDDAHGLLNAMRQQNVLVEICLTSNEAILQVQGPAHPFTLYRMHRIPLTLATDDEGISRIDLSHEYQLATQRYRLGYPDLKQLARNSLEYSFLAGPSLWKSGGYRALVASCASDRPGERLPSRTCSAFLASSDRAQAQWRLEAEFASFEALPQWRP
ncbi:MAG: adenosine deaminase [Synechococcaceae cyanobacterium]